MVEDMSSRLRDSLLRRKEATSAGSDQTKDVRSNGATDAATPPATDKATRDATELATRAGLQPRTQEATVRRAYTVFTRQDELLADLARELRTDKSDVLRQIIDAWLAMH